MDDGESGEGNYGVELRCDYVGLESMTVVMEDVRSLVAFEFLVELLLGIREFGFLGRVLGVG